MAVAPIYAENSVYTVGTSQVSISPPRPRTVIVFTNTSTAGQNLTLQFGMGSATAGSGIVLAPGDKYGEANGDGFVCFQGPVYAIADAAGATLSYYER